MHSDLLKHLGYAMIVFLAIGLDHDVGAMEIVDGKLRIPTSEITLIWEHYCMKHMARNEWHLARLNKKVIEFQLANRQYYGHKPERLSHFQKLLKEAQVAKEKAGTSWKCDPPEAKIAFTKLKVGLCGEGKIPESFISNSDDTVETEARVRLVDNNCENPKIEWKISAPKYDVSKSSTVYFTASEGNEDALVPSGGLGDDEIAYACTKAASDERRKIGNFEAVMASFRCGYITYEINKIVSNLASAFTHLLSIPKAPAGDRGSDLKVNVEAKLFCDGDLSDNTIARVGQDERDQLRQEYVDMGKQTIPERNDLISYLKTKHFNLDEFNSSKKTGGGKYEYVLCKILDKIENVRSKAGNVSMKISSGYRNPHKQATLSKAKEGLHMYGLAADIRRDDFDGDGDKDENDWKVIADAAKEEGACIEPMDDAPTWIHMDWRGECPKNW